MSHKDTSLLAMTVAAHSCALLNGITSSTIKVNQTMQRKDPLRTMARASRISGLKGASLTVREFDTFSYKTQQDKV